MSGEYGFIDGVVVGSMLSFIVYYIITPIYLAIRDERIKGLRSKLGIPQLEDEIKSLQERRW
jgi:hypothetical protein